MNQAPLSTAEESPSIKQPPLKMTPNQITLLRLALALPAFIFWFFSTSPYIKNTIVLIYCFIFLLDSVDGFVAKKYQMTTTLGGLFDPVVDHVSINLFTLLLIAQGILPLWFIAPIYLRDSLVTLLRQIGQTQEKYIIASNFAKIKAEVCYYFLPALFFLQGQHSNTTYGIVFALLAMFMIIIHPNIFHYDWTYRSSMIKLWIGIFAVLCTYPLWPSFATLMKAIVMGAVLLVYVGSGVHYFYANRKLLKG